MRERKCLQCDHEFVTEETAVKSSARRPIKGAQGRPSKAQGTIASLRKTA